MPVEVDVASIEKELRLLWRSASRQEGEQAAIRACSCNFVAIVRDEIEAAAFVPVVARLAEWHPCRALLAYSHPPFAGEPELPMRAWISAQCSVPLAGGPQICSEVVTLETNTGAARDLLSALLPLLVPDLPVALYWRSPDIDDADLVGSLIPFADLMVVDSHRACDAASERRMFEILLKPRAGLAIRDLNWARLTPWRELIAGFFDGAAARESLRDIREVMMSQAHDRAGCAPVRLLLLAGWLASRLGWQRSARLKTGDRWDVRWKAGTGEVRTLLRSWTTRQEGFSGIDGVDMRTGSGDAFVVARDPGSGSATASVTSAGKVWAYAASLDEADEAALLTKELSISGFDAGYLKALAAAFDLDPWMEGSERAPGGGSR